MSTGFDAAVSPWKPCDLRGPYPESISETLFADVGAAIGTMLPIGASALVSGDFRNSTVALKTALCDGLMSAGAEVLDAGQLPTPVAYFTSREQRAQAVLIVTASHNPACDNGLKFMLHGRPPSPAQLLDIRSRTEARAFRRHNGTIRPVDSTDVYERQILSRWSNLDPRDLPPLILDTGNGAWSNLAPHIFRQLGFTFKCLGCEPDGRFPSRPPDCARTANLQALRTTVAEDPGSIGIAWDGDGDRVALVDENAQHVPTDEIALLLARELLTDRGDSRQQAVVIDIKFSDLVRRSVQELGGVALLERSGHSFMRTRLMEEDAVLGLDACGHYFFRELQHGDDGLFSALFLLYIMQMRGGSLANLRKSLPRLFVSPELRVPASTLSYQVIVASSKTHFLRPNFPPSTGHACLCPTA